MIGRREFITLLGGAAAWPTAARAQQGDRMRRIGVLATSAETTEARTRVATFLQTMHNLGWREDQTLRVDIRWVGSDPQRIQSETADLLARKPEVIVSGTSVAIAQVLRTSSIAIVFAGDHRSGQPRFRQEPGASRSAVPGMAHFLAQPQAQYCRHGPVRCSDH
jgi:putative ABC transport system substrate-binding protein